MSQEMPFDQADVAGASAYPKVYWAYAKDDTLRRRSSSGGVFGLLAKDVISQGGLVVGARFSDDCLSVRHVAISSEEELEPLLSSKYVWSSVPAELYATIAHALREGRRVLFSGVGCQLVALKNRIGELASDKNLLCVEVICHGMPLPGLWKPWVGHLEDRFHSRLQSVNFRDKSSGWPSYSVLYEFEDGARLRQFALDDWYMRVYLNNLSLRRGCASCPAKTTLPGDLILGDFWGIQRLRPRMSWGKGVSSVVVRSARGEEALKRIVSQIGFGITDYDSLARANPSLGAPPELPEGSAEFASMVQHGARVEEIMKAFPLERTHVQRLFSRANSVRSQLNARFGE